MGFVPDESGIQAIQACINALKESVETMKGESNKLRSHLAQNRNSLASNHAKDIETLIEELDAQVLSASGPVNELTVKMSSYKRKLEEFLAMGVK